MKIKTDDGVTLEVTFYPGSIGDQGERVYDEEPKNQSRLSWSDVSIDSDTGSMLDQIRQDLDLSCDLFDTGVIEMGLIEVDQDGQKSRHHSYDWAITVRNDGVQKLADVLRRGR
jgi:hypothetical protein